MIHSFAFAKQKIGDLGRVVAIRNSIVWVDGLRGATIGEVVSFEDNTHGLVVGLSENRVEIAVFSNDLLHIGDQVARVGESLHVSVGSEMVGSVIDALGYTVDGPKDLSEDSEARPVIDVPAVSIAGRRRIEDFFTTGTAAVDLIVPLGKGQRELVLGDRGSGKTFFTLRTIITQARRGAICVLALIAKRKTEIKQVVEVLKSEGVFEQCVIVASDAQASLGEIYATPYTAMTVAEHFRDQGQEVLLVLDDLTTHASFYREMALLMGRFPGRDSYPGEIFYIHSNLLERAGNFLVKGKPVSITCLPVAETAVGDMTGYIQTNLMSMTDGHIYFDKSLFFKGQRPSINVFLSITRVGRQTQTPLLRDVSTRLMEAMQGAEHLKRFARFGSEITNRATQTLHLIDDLWQLFAQDHYRSYEVPVQLLLLSMTWQGKLALAKAPQLHMYLANKKFVQKIEVLMAKAKTFEQFLQVSEEIQQQLYEVSQSSS